MVSHGPLSSKNSRTCTVSLATYFKSTESLQVLVGFVECFSSLWMAILFSSRRRSDTESVVRLSCTFYSLDQRTPCSRWHNVANARSPAQGSAPSAKNRHLRDDSSGSLRPSCALLYKIDSGISFALKESCEHFILYLLCYFVLRGPRYAS